MSHVEPAREYNSSCGYCSSEEEGRVAYGMSANSLTCEDYQALIDRGWRRSGTWLYLPNNAKSCCPNYTIRLDVKKFRASKSQKRVLKTAKQILLPRKKSVKLVHKGLESPPMLPPALQALLNTQLRVSLQSCADRGEVPRFKGTIEDIAVMTVVAPVSVAGHPVRGHATSNVALRLAASAAAAQGQEEEEAGASSSRRLSARAIAEALVQSLNAAAADSWVGGGAGGASTATAGCTTAAVQWSVGGPGFVNARLSEAAATHHLTLAAATGVAAVAASDATNIPPAGSEEKASSADTSGADCSSSSSSIGKATLPAVAAPPTPSAAGSITDAISSRLVVTSAPAVFTDESFALYKKYQIAVHGDKPEEVTEKGFTGFLVTSPLIPLPPPAGTAALGSTAAKDGSTLAQGYGSFHHYYRIDGVLVALGVVDVLPRCLSSVYFIYDPDWMRLQLGKLSALLEIEWVRRARRVSPRLHYYYMGYYVHNCVKMRYKAEYRPSDLLCSETHQWVPLSLCLPALRNARYAPFAPLLPAAAPTAPAAAAGQPPPAAAAAAAVGGGGGGDGRDDGDDSDSGGYVSPPPPSAARDAALLSGAMLRRLLRRIPITLSFGQVTLGDLNQRGIAILTPILEDYATRVGPQLALRMKVGIR